MSPLQSTDSVAEPIHDEHEVTQQPRLSVTDALALPALCGPQDMRRLFGIGASRFCKLNQQGAYDRFKVTPAIGPRCFSGVLIARYLSGEPLYLPTVGRKR